MGALPCGVGLTEAEAARLLVEHGPNQLPGQRPESPLRLLLRVLSEPMLLLLLGAGSVYLALGDPGEAGLMLTFVGFVAGLTWFQERRTRRALEALRDLTAPRALVVREGRERRLPAREVVPGDLLVLQEGDRIPADARLCDGLASVDESLLTGESMAITKVVGDPVSAGTLVVQGRAWAKVFATGSGTALGKLGKSLAALQPEVSTLQKASRALVLRLAWGGIGLAVVTVLLAWLWVGRSFLQSLLQGLTLAIALLPEEIPVVLTVFLAMGAWRISHRQVLTRRMPAVETLGSITVLAVDKTGTLTQNRMALTELRTEDLQVEEQENAPLPEAAHALVEYAVLASPANAFDPMEVAIQAFSARHLEGTEHLHEGWRPVRTYDLSRDILAVTRSYSQGGSFLLAAKGAPEAVADLCHLPAQGLASIRADFTAMAGKGLRVLGVARGRFQGGSWPPSQHDFDFEWLGLLGFQDPPRPEVPAAIAACQSAGVRVLMLTGDHPETARAIARAVGLPAEGPMLLGPELDALDDADLAHRLKDVSLCARVHPEQKVRLVRALQALGEVVAMTGDGVNDAPALQAAHVGVAMGARGTDVAREAASLVLLDDGFGSLVAAIEEGRRIYGNLVKAMQFIIAIHVPVIGLSFLALAWQWPMLLLPAHILLLQLIVDPTCSIVLEAEPGDANLMARPPRPVDESPFRRSIWLHASLQGAGLWFVLGGLALWGQDRGWTMASLRSACMAGVAMGAFLLVLAIRSRNQRCRNPWIPRLGVGMLGAMGVLALLPGLRSMLDLGPLGLDAWLGLLVAGALFQAWLGACRRWAPC